MKRLLTRAATAVLLTFVLVGASCQPITQPAPTPPAPLDRVQISLEAVTLTPGGVQQLSAMALDQYGNELAGVQFSYTAEQGGMIDEQGRFIADTKAGDYPKAIKVVARQGEIVRSAFVSLKIVPGPLERFGHTRYFRYGALC